MRAAVTIVLVALLAGCATAPETSDSAAVAPASTESEILIDAPAWERGQWWTYRFNDGSTYTWVVTDVASGYTVHVDDADLAFSDVLDDISTIGPITKRLEGAQEGQLIQFFDWPLAQNKTWELIWDGQTFTATASVAGDEAMVEAIADDGEIRRYGYDNATQWFSFIEGVDGNGSIVWRVEQVANGMQYAGTYVRYDIYPHLDHTWGAGPVRGTMDGLNVTADAAELWYDLTLACGTDNGQAMYALVPPGANQEGLVSSDDCPDEIHERGVIPAYEGLWRSSATANDVAGRVVVIPRTMFEETL